MHEEMEQRTEGEQDDGERTERMRTMLAHEEKRRDGEKTNQRQELPLAAHGHPLGRRNLTHNRVNASRQSSPAMMRSHGANPVAVRIPLESFGIPAIQIHDTPLRVPPPTPPS